MDDASKYVVTFGYMDQVKVEVTVPPDDIEAFTSAVGKGEVHYNDERGRGVWIPIEKIRYFKVEKVDEKGRYKKIYKVYE